MVKHIDIYPDASGAPAVVTVLGQTFAIDTVGGVRLHRISGTAVTRGSLQKAIAIATAEYVAARQVGADWLNRNAEMYAR